MGSGRTWSETNPEVLVAQVFVSDEIGETANI